MLACKYTYVNNSLSVRAAESLLSYLHNLHAAHIYTPDKGKNRNCNICFHTINAGGQYQEPKNAVDSW